MRMSREDLENIVEHVPVGDLWAGTSTGGH